MRIIIYIAFSLVQFILAVIIHELGHLVFGLLTGYGFSYLRIFNLVLLKENGKLMLMRSKGIFMGQCLMSPPENEKSFRFVWYNLGGGTFNLLAMAAMLVPMGEISVRSNLWMPLFCGVLMNGTLAATNLLPLSIGLPNDGMNVLTALRSDEARRGLFLMLLINAKTSAGMRHRDLEPEIFSLPQTADFGNYFVAYIVMCDAARLYDMGLYDESARQYSRLPLDKIQSFYRNSIKQDLMYYYTVHRPDFEKASEIYGDKKIKSHLKLSLPMVTRTLAAYEFFINSDMEKGRELLQKAKKEAAAYPNSGIAIMESDYCTELERLFENTSPV